MRTLKTPILEGQIAQLLPLHKSHFEALWAIAKEKEIWQFMPQQIENKKDFRNYWQKSLKKRDRGEAMPFTIIDRRSGEIVGCTRFQDIDPDNQKLEIGSTWYSPEARGSGLNKEVKFLMLQYAFETLEVVRVQLKINVLNIRSQRAIEKIGATREGVLRQFAMNPDGSFRDTVFYSFIRSEWETLSLR